jgi:hypothetical protein
MHFLVTLYGKQSTWGSQDPAQHATEMSAFGDFERSARADGVWVGSLALQPADQAVTVRRGGDAPPVVASGPVAAAEQLGACYLLDCPDRESAVQWAQQIPLVGDGGFTAVEVRPVLDASGSVIE